MARNCCKADSCLSYVIFYSVTLGSTLLIVSIMMYISCPVPQCHWTGILLGAGIFCAVTPWCCLIICTTTRSCWGNGDEDDNKDLESKRLKNGNGDILVSVDKLKAKLHKILQKCDKLNTLDDHKQDLQEIYKTVGQIKTRITEWRNAIKQEDHCPSKLEIQEVEDVLTILNLKLRRLKGDTSGAAPSSDSSEDDSPFSIPMLPAYQLTDPFPEARVEAEAQAAREAIARVPRYLRGPPSEETDAPPLYDNGNQ